VPVSARASTEVFAVSHHEKGMKKDTGGSKKDAGKKTSGGK
jgi:hypothetical protein